MNDQFENYAREQINGYEADIDAEAMWDDIAPIVTEKRKKRRFFWIFFFGLGISLSSFGAFYLIQNTQNQATHVSTPINALNDIQDTITDNRIIYDEETDAIKRKVVKTRFQPKSSIQPIVQTLVNPVNLREPLLASIIKAKKKELFVQKETVSSEIKGQKDNLYSISNKEVNGILRNIDSSQTSSSSSLQLIPKIDLETSPNVDTQIMTKVWNVPTDIVLDVPLKFLKYNAFFNFKKAAYFLDSHNLSLEESPKKRNEFSDKKNKIGLGLYTGFSNSIYHLAARDSIYEQYKTVRDSTEEQLSTFHIGLSAIMLNKRNFHLRTGVEYTVMNRLFSNEEVFNLIDSTLRVKEIRVNTITGDSIFILDSIFSTTTVLHNIKRYNYTYIIDVPLIVGYHFEKGSWGFGLEAGIHASILIKHEGKILAADQSIYDKDVDSKKWYKNIGIRPYLGLMATYRLSDQLQLHVSPSVLLNTAFSSDTNPIKEKSSSYGVRVGVQYYFDGR